MRKRKAKRDAQDFSERSASTGGGVFDIASGQVRLLA
jgi:hypothetical protein